MSALNLQPGPWLAVSPIVRAAYLRAAVQVATRRAEAVGEPRDEYCYWRTFDEVLGCGQGGDWPSNAEGREIVAAVVEEASWTTAVDLTDDGAWDCARAALVVAAGVIA